MKSKPYATEKQYQLITPFAQNYGVRKTIPFL